MIDKEIDVEISKLSHLVDIGEFQSAFERALQLLEEIKKLSTGEASRYLLLFNISGIFIDVGSMQPNPDSTEIGFKIMQSHAEKFISLIGESDYYYNLSNAKSDLITEKNPFKQTFYSIEELVKLKSFLWKAIKATNRDKAVVPPEYIVNLGNSLRQQFRIVEALRYYDQVIRENLDIPQAWVNRSETLIMLNIISNTYSIQMLEQIKKGYENAIKSKKILPQLVGDYQEQIKLFAEKIKDICNENEIAKDEHDENLTKKEYEEFGNFRKFCLQNYLTLSEHALYCPCIGSARDNLTIPTESGVVGDFIIPMEMILNRLKSEFSFARRLYYEYLNCEENNELQHESCFSQLFNDEVLGVNVEKLRTAFRLCFGILDKIGVAICELYDVYPSSDKKAYFQNLWQLDKKNRRNKFEALKNPGLLALYSIASDLNEHKNGEWKDYKEWRNNLEHQFLVVHRSENRSDIYDSYKFIEGIVFIKEVDFIQHLEQMLQLTRSAIFSFVFSVREKGLQERNKQNDDKYFTNTIFWQDYKFE